MKEILSFLNALANIPDTRDRATPSFIKGFITQHKDTLTSYQIEQLESVVDMFEKGASESKILEDLIRANSLNEYILYGYITVEKDGSITFKESVIIESDLDPKQGYVTTPGERFYIDNGNLINTDPDYKYIRPITSIVSICDNSEGRWYPTCNAFRMFVSWPGIEDFYYIKLDDGSYRHFQDFYQGERRYGDEVKYCSVNEIPEPSI